MATEEPDLRLKINGKLYELQSFDDLDLDETGIIEDLVGQPFETMTGEQFLLKKVMKAFAYILISRKNPNFTFAEAGKLKLSDFETPEAPADDGDGEAADPPTEPAAAKRRKSAAKASTAT